MKVEKDKLKEKVTRNDGSTGSFEQFKLVHVGRLSKSNEETAWPLRNVKEKEKKKRSNLLCTIFEDMITVLSLRHKMKCTEGTLKQLPIRIPLHSFKLCVWVFFHLLSFTARLSPACTPSYDAGSSRAP